jgi:HEAT repeat protein
MKFKFLLPFLIAGMFFTQALGARSLDESAAGLDSDNAGVRLLAVRNLSIHHLPDGVPFFIMAAGDPDPDVRARAISALGLSGDSRGIAAVRKGVEDLHWEVRWRSLQAMEKLGDKGALPLIMPKLSDDSVRVRVSAVKALNRADGPEVVDHLAIALKDRNENVRLAAARALAGRKHNSAYRPLVDLLRYGSMYVRDEAAAALAVLGDPRAVEPLIDAVADPNNRVSLEGRDWVIGGATKALIDLTGQNFGRDADAWREWWAENRGRLMAK